MNPDGKKRRLLIGAALILLLAMVPVLAAATPLVTTDLNLHKITPKHVGQRFLIRGNLSYFAYDPVHKIGSAAYLPGRTVELYRRPGSSDTWEPLSTQTTDVLGGYRLPMQEFKKGKFHYLAVFQGEPTFPGSYESTTVTIE